LIIKQSQILQKHQQSTKILALAARKSLMQGKSSTCDFEGKLTIDTGMLQITLDL
jgi:hypothetical protein